MPEAAANFQELMDRIRQGCPEAARELTERYGPHIRCVVRRRLDRRLRGRFDSLDFVQDVWASFFADQFRTCDLNGDEALVAYLVTIARNKVIDAGRGYQREHPGTCPEQSLDADPAGARAVLGDEPTPSQTACANENWDLRLQELPAHHRRVVLLVYDGQPAKEVARQLGIPERTVYRILRRFAPLQVAP